MRLIDADKFKAYMLEEYICYDHTLADIDKQPTVDIDAITESHEKIGYDKGFRDGYAQATSEVKHGHWTNISVSVTGNSSAECSLCGTVVHDTFADVNRISYCPHCGAKMDAVEEYV